MIHQKYPKMINQSERIGKMLRMFFSKHKWNRQNDKKFCTNISQGTTGAMTNQNDQIIHKSWRGYQP